MKKLFRYFILFLAFFFVIELLTNLEMKEHFNNKPKYTINIESPKIDVKDSKASYTSGYIKGSIINDTKALITNKYLQFDFYDKDGVYKGTESKEIKIFNVNEKVPFDINYNYENIDKVDIKFVDEIKKPDGKLASLVNYFKYDENDIAKKIGLPIGLFLAITALIP